MIVNKLEKNKKGYSIVIDDQKYQFDEEIIVEYRLVKGKEIDENTLNEAIKKNTMVKYYNLALNYSLKYGKCKKATKEYLIDNGLLPYEADLIADELEKKNIINDKKLIESVIYHLTKTGNGINLIRKKLYEKGFSSSLIEESLNMIDYEIYYNVLEKLYNKSSLKYIKEENSYIKEIKIKKYLLSRGYLLSEIDDIDKKC